MSVCAANVRVDDLHPPVSGCQSAIGTEHLSQSIRDRKHQSQRQSPAKDFLIADRDPPWLTRQFISDEIGNVMNHFLFHVFLVHGQVTIIFVVCVGLSVSLCRVFLSRL